MCKIMRYEDLALWQKAHKFVLDIYEISKEFPNSEMFGLTSQLRRASISVPANIAEGSKRQHTKELIQFLYVSKGSLGESEYYLRLAKDLGFISDENFIKRFEQCDEISRMIAGLIKSLKSGKNCV